MSDHTILVVDDEPALLAGTARLLQNAGYDVLQAQDGAEAIEVAETIGIDLLLTDSVMPHGSGPELAADLRRRFPTLPVVVMTGDATSAELSDRADLVVLAKPFTQEQLLDVVRDALRV